MFALVALLGLVAAPAGATVFPNTAPITIPASGTGPGQSNPYPSAISVTGLTGTVVDVNVTLNNLSHTANSDNDVLLVGPNGQNVVLMADVSNANTTNVTLTFDDAAAATVPPNAVVSGTYRPTNINAFNGTPPAPAGPYGSTLAVFNGTTPNGTWNLFWYDDAGADVGSLAGGWSLNITTNGPTIASFNPTSGPPGTSVTITGTNLSPFTSVAFGGATASVTSSSSTQLVATVPNNATTGPITVVTPSGTATSSTNFTVISLRHSRDVSLNVGRKARGHVTVEDGFSACASDVPVKLQHRENGRWRSAGTTLTNSNAGFAIRVFEFGTFRAIAKKVTMASGDVCLKAVSPRARG